MKTKEEILQRLKENKQEKKQLKKQLAELPSLEVGRWYKDEYENRKRVIFVTEYDHGRYCYYGDNDLYWTDKEYFTDISATCKNLTPATDKEVETALIKEAEKRGFKEGVKIKGMLSGNPQYLTDDLHYEPTHHIKERVNSLSSFWTMIFRNGKWAEIIEQPKTIHLEVGDYTKENLTDLINNRF